MVDGLGVTFLLLMVKLSTVGNQRVAFNFKRDLILKTAGWPE